MGGKIAVGILVESDQIPHWMYYLIKTIMNSDYAEIALVVKKADSLPSNNQNSNLDENCKNFLFSSYWKLDKFLNKLAPNAFELQNWRPLLSGVPQVVASSIKQGSGGEFSEEDCGKLHAHKLDVFISLGVGDLCGELIACAKYGVWLFQQGDNRRGGSREGAVFQDFFAGCGEGAATLKILTGACEKGRALSKSYEQTDKLSVASYQNIIYWKTVTFILRKLREVHSLGETEFFARVQQDNQYPAFNSGVNSSAFKMSEWIGLMLRHIKKIIDKKLTKLCYFDQYILLFDVKEGSGFSSIVTNYQKMIPPRDRFWADPFIVYENNKYYVFIEEVIAPNHRGHISCLTIDEAGVPSMPQKIIEQPYHMSYPFVFSYNNEYYMIPETSENRTIDLYKCIEFPHKWEMVTTLMRNITAADATLLQKDGKWWLFASVCEQEGTPSNDELFLFFTEDLFSGNWTPHVKNPIVSDVRSARPAGRIFVYHGDVYRPSQNSSRRYGFGVKINHIVALSETEYEEICISDIEPRWDQAIIAVHTLNFAHQLTIIDGLLKRRRHLSDYLRYFRKRWGPAQWAKMFHLGGQP
jgi:hypothetical protein